MDSSPFCENHQCRMDLEPQKIPGFLCFANLLPRHILHGADGLIAVDVQEHFRKRAQKTQETAERFERMVEAVIREIRAAVEKSIPIITLSFTVRDEVPDLDPWGNEIFQEVEREELPLPEVLNSIPEPRIHFNKTENSPFEDNLIRDPFRKTLTRIGIKRPLIIGLNQTACLYETAEWFSSLQMGFPMIPRSVSTDINMSEWEVDAFFRLRNRSAMLVD